MQSSVRWLRGVARSGTHVQVLGGAFCALLCACGGSQDQPPPRTIWPERLQACQTLLNELASVDTQSAEEATLQAAMERADANREECTALFLETADSAGSQLLARHRGREFTLQALQIESALSYRFDNRQHYCEIIRETFVLLLQGVAELEAALLDGIGSPDEIRQMTELRDLDLEALDVLYEATDSFCALEGN
jgi:hypothetical protein